MASRTEGCIALGGLGNTIDSVRMLSLASNELVTRDKYVTLPIPDIVVNHINATAEVDGFVRGADPSVASL